MSDFVDRISKLSPKQLLLLAVEQQKRLEALAQAKREPIAVIGIGCRFPGGADSPQQFWDLLRDGRDAIREVPEDRWNIDALFDPDPDAPARMSVRTGGFLDRVSDFDAAFFGIAPREALSMDPQHRLLLEVAWEALEHAGLAAEQLAGSSTGVFVGICNQDHFVRLLHRGADAIDAYLASGNSPSVAAGRIAYSLGLQGPALAVDTSCSSSLVALHLACRSLRSGETRMALACGVNVMCSPEAGIALSKAHMLASDGRCKTFDAAADGYARGEGCGVLVLKRQSDAVADGDNILAVLRGTAVNQDGRSGGLTVPNGPAQESVIRAALADGGVDPQEIDYVEAHGTGTSLGDPIEARALSRVMGATRDAGDALLIGSVKTNIGHLESAAGVAGVIKVILAMQHEQIPPHLHFQQPSPHIPWSDYRLAVTADAYPWPQGERRRLAGVSSFGFSGTNAHVVLQDAPPGQPARAEPRSFHCLPLSARSETALVELATRYAEAISAGATLADVAHTAGTGRSHFSHRLAVVANTIDVARQALTAFAEGKPHPAIQHGICVPSKTNDIAFLFAAGSDGACLGMGRLLYETSRVYRDAIDQCDRLVGADVDGRTLKSVLWPSTDDGAEPAGAALTLQALVAAQYATAQLWKSFGIEPAAVIGDAIGEYAAACVAGVLSLEDTLRLLVRRGQRARAGDLVPDTIAACVDEIRMNAPRIAVAWTGSGSEALGLGDVPSAEYWQTEPCGPVRLAAAFGTLYRAGFRSFLDLGPNSALISLAKDSLPAEGNLFVTSLRPGVDDWAAIANGLAALYVQGATINWGGVSKGAQKIPLPTYPFERRRYWRSPSQIEEQYEAGASRNQGPLTGRRLQATTQVASSTNVSPRADASVAMDDLFYRVVWEQASPISHGAAWLRGLEQSSDTLRKRFAALASHHGLAIYDRLVPELDRLCADYIARALRLLGFNTTAGRIFVAEEEAMRLGVAQRHVRLFTRLLEMLAEDGVLRNDGSSFETIKPLPFVDPEHDCATALAEFGDVDSELLILQRCGRELPRLLTGEQDPLQLLFLGGSFAEARKLYIESPWARTYNGALCDALTSAIRDLPTGVPLRVLEIGGGTGGTTNYVLPLLPADRTEYTFTDLSPLFLERAAEQFASYPFLRTALLDIENDPDTQIFRPDQFDVIVAANVLHATRDLTDAVTHAHRLLAPGGLLLLLEGVAPRRWTDLTFGFTEGWWRFSDAALRPNYPLISVAKWRYLLEKVGFDGIAAIPEGETIASSQAQQALIVARKSACTRSWAIVGDRHVLGSTLADRMRARGEQVKLLDADAPESAVMDGDHLIYLGALELASYQRDDVAAVAACEALACALPIRWLARFGRAAEAGQAWLVTRGAQPVQAQIAPVARWQSPLWGVGRSFSLERPDRWGGLIDLPADCAAETLAETLIGAIDAGDAEDQVAYRDGNRYVARLVRTSAPVQTKPRLLRGATYLVTGGFGGLGLLVARWLADNGARHIALLGRHPDPTSEEIRAIEALGARVISIAGDVADEAEMRTALDRLQAEAPPLRGIIHAATDANATLIDQMTTAQVSAMLRPKIAGTVVLERLTKNADLDVIVLFSSTASLTGLAGLAHYAAASAFLDATAFASGERRILSINWGAWERIRMASAEAQRSLHEGGLEPMPAEVALDALGRLLGTSEPQGIVARIDWARYKALLETRRLRPFLSRLDGVTKRVAAERSPARLESDTPNLAERMAQAPVAARPALLLEFVRGEVAAVLAAAGDAIADEQDLFASGMDSLMSVELKRRLEAGIGESLPSGVTFNHPSIGALAAFLASRLDGASADDAVVAASAIPQRSHPLSYSQKALWFLHQQDVQSTAYHVSLSVRVQSRLDEAALRRAMQRVIDRHSILRTTYILIDGAPQQRISQQQDATFEVHSIGGLNDDGLRKLLEADARRPFDLEYGPIIRASLYTRAPEDHALLLSVHHIAIDGWSILMLIEELLTAYGEMTGGPVAVLVQPELEYGDYARWQEEMLGGAEGDRLWSYWQRKLAAPRARIELPTDHPRPAIQSFNGASVAFQADALTAQRVTNFARDGRTTPFVVLLAAFQVFLFKLAGAEDVIVGTSTFARSKPEFMQIAGDFVNSVPIRGRLASTMTFRDFVLQLGSTVVEAIEAQEFPLPLMVQRLQPERNAGGSPLFDTFFSLLRFQQFKAFALLYGSGSDSSVNIGGLSLAPFPIDQGAGQFDLSVQMVEIAGSLRGAFNYRTDLYEEGTIRGFTAEYLALVDTLTSDPDMALGAVRKPAARDEGVATLLDLLGKRDIRLLLDGDRLRINAPRGALDDALKAAIAARRDDIIRHLKEPGTLAKESEPTAIRRIPRDRRVPASSAQQRLWFLDRIDPGRPTYNIGGGLRLRGLLDIGLLRQAINTLTSRHEAFRTRILEHNGQPWLEILETSLTPVDIVDLSDRPAETRNAEVQQLGERLMKTPFDMAHGLLAAVLIVRLAADDHAVILAMHHVVTDGWSLSIAWHEVCTLYDALATGRAAKLAPLAIDYADYAAWEAEQISAGRFEEHLAYWKGQLQGAPATLELPTDRPRPPVPSRRGGRVRRFFDSGLVASLEVYRREHSATLFMTMLAAWQVLMHRYSGQDDIVIGTPIANRDTPALEGVVGCLVNNIPLRAHLGGNPTFAEFLCQVKQTTLNAFDHRALPFDKLVQGLNPERNVSHAPIFQVLFTLMSFPVQSLTPAGLTAEPVELDLGTSRFDLTIEMGPITTGTHAGEFGALYDFDSDLFDDPTIARLHDHFVNLLGAVAKNTHCGIQDLPLITADEARQFLEERNATALVHDRASCVHHLLEASARSTPNALAATAGDATLNYRALDQKANRLAHLLRRRGIGPKALVAVCLDRTIDIPIVLAAVLKAGATYVPLDPTHPEERLHYILEDAEVACVITVSSFLPIFDSAVTPTLLLDQEYETLALQPDTAPDVPVRPDGLAYVIYTSGSTGRPKGVEVEHRNVVSFLRAMQREPGLTAADTLLAVTTLSFDIAGLEIWLPLSVGGHVVIASRTDVLDGARLIDLIETHGITVFQATPASWRLLLEANWQGKRDLKALCGGEAMPRDLAAALVERTGELWNMYGPTETTIWSTVECVQDATGPITIGHPIANTRVYVLDLSGQRAPVGVIGELCIGGEGVARGYRKRAELTSEKFVEITLPDGTAERVYRTADMARFHADGRLELLGRRDHQVKVRGYRVELGEIEAVLATVAGVKTCVVVTRELAPGDERLVGYVTTTAGSRFDTEQARAVLRRKLPEYMIPQLFMVLAALPMTPNNKIDRKALPAPQTPDLASDDPDLALLTPSQRRVAELWRSVLRTEIVRLHDNFFDLGGHSLLLVKLHAELKREFAADFPLVELFQQTTVAAQADRLSSMSRSNDALVRARTRAERQLHG